MEREAETEGSRVYEPTRGWGVPRVCGTLERFTFSRSVSCVEEVPRLQAMWSDIDEQSTRFVRFVQSYSQARDKYN